MKKKIMLSILSLLALASCTGSETSSTSSPDVSSKESSSTVEEKGWTEEQKKTMQDHLYGEILPYSDFGNGATIKYSFGQFQVLGADTINKDTLKAYASLYTTENGWEDATSSYGDLIPSENYYVFDKTIQKDEEEVYVEVKIYAFDTSSKEPSSEGSGTFILNALGDGLFTSFPSDVLDEETAKRGSNVKIPPFSATSYKVTDPDAFEFICYTEDTNPEETYKTAFPTTEFTVTKVEDEENQYYPYCIGVSSDNIYAVAFAFYAEEKALQILLLEEVPTAENN